MSGEQIKPGYKRTEVGVIPDDWEVVPIASLIERNTRITYGVVQPGKDDPRGVLFVRGGDVYDGTIDQKNLRRITITVSKQYARTQLRGGELLISLVGFPGECAIAPPDLKGANLARQVALVRFSENGDFNPEYICHLLRSSTGKRLLLKDAFGSAQQVINLKDVNKLEIPLPNRFDEQIAIATALSDTDALLAKLDQLIAKKRDLKQAAMQQLLTGQTRLPGFSGEWKVNRLGDFGNCLRGVTYKGDNDLWPHDTAQTKRLLRSNNVQNSTVVIEDIQFVTSNRVTPQQLLRKNDILICMANGSKALVGKAGFFDVADGYEYTFGAFMGCFRTKDNASDPAFVFYLFQTARYRNYINNLLAGSSINNLNPGSIESLEFHIPEKEEQTAIATVLSGMDAEIATLESRRNKTRSLKQGMMQELLTGRIRLV